MKVTLILASSSPRRQQLADALPWRVVIRPVDVDEQEKEKETGLELVRRLAALKALTAFSNLTPAEKRKQEGRTLIVGADTLLEVEGRILGKPKDDGQAMEFLHRLRQSSHEVHSGICIVDVYTGQTVAETHTSYISLRDFTNSEMATYVATGQHLDKAGAYNLQDKELRPVAKLEGCASSVIGLPLGIFADLCERDFHCALTRAYPDLCSSVTGHPCCRASHCPEE